MTVLDSDLRVGIPFTLPHGVVGPDGRRHRQGVMRAATAGDEIRCLRDPAVRENHAYLSVLLLARVVESIGDLADITPEVVEDLLARDFDHLQRLYERINSDTGAVGSLTCPYCSQGFEVDLSEIGDALDGGGPGG